MKFFRNRILPLLLFFAFFGGAVLDAAPARLRSIWSGGRRSVHLLDAAAGLSAVALRSAAQITLSKGKERLVFYPARRYASFNNVRVNLCHPLLMQGQNPYLGKVDCDNMLVPFLGAKTPYKHRVGKIVLDPGHGGRDQGTAGQRLQEKTITLNLANRVAGILRAYGYRVELTRTRDTTLSLDARSAYANRTGADLFVSIHVNSAADRGVRGIETFCLTPEGAASSNSGKPDGRSYAGNAKNPNNFLLAYNLQRSMLVQTRAEDRGVKFARFAVLRDIRCPGALVEVGFVSNRSDEANLGSAAYQDKLARGIAAGILNYHRSLAR
ncbi:MAG: N-acetylmuramoyl-L-alanine amidase [Lentisphaeria bacterium]|nr:N-acetylmuramoyl-L-alanine amidase [Lentisphaeria bacterium]